MRLTSTPPFLNRSWRDLWQAKIPDLQTLKETKSSTIFVAVDAEPLFSGSNQVAEIGISALAPINPAANPPRSTCLATLRQHHDIRATCIRPIRSSRQVLKNHREPFWQSEAVVVYSHDIEYAAVEVLRSIPSAWPKAPFLGQPATLCLVGFDLGYEFRVLSISYPPVLKLFSSWVDVQELVQAATGEQKQPSMCHTLLAFGFEKALRERGHEFALPRAVGAHIMHNTGNDTVRIIAVLANLLTFDFTLKITPTFTSSGRTTKRNERQWLRNQSLHKHKGKPKPRAFHPFMAQVTRADDTERRVFPSHLLTTFSDYNPTATGVTKRIPNTPSCKGWVCLPSFDELQRFVAEVDGIPRADGVWHARSMFDTSSTTMRTAEEVEKFREEYIQAEKESKIKKRKE